MRSAVVLLTFVAVLLSGVGRAHCQTAGEVFRSVVPSVVVIRATGREVGASGIISVTTTGSGEIVRARVVGSEPAADLPAGASHTVTVLRAGRIVELTAVAP